ncbi:hypothetical protein BE17_23955 [Sorangium cellulosum]|uniref:Uncharacterized protein n=1 Tax=Sorangium cellulosum TaxID=56 RepID=A0A150SFI7_SORCE|nr:hypothetical protein BE17_23955 [Sorangium cellulosum]
MAGEGRRRFAAGRREVPRGCGAEVRACCGAEVRTCCGAEVRTCCGADVLRRGGAADNLSGTASCAGQLVIRLGRCA